MVNRLVFERRDRQLVISTTRHPDDQPLLFTSFFVTLCDSPLLPRSAQGRRTQLQDSQHTGTAESSMVFIMKTRKLTVYEKKRVPTVDDRWKNQSRVVIGVVQPKDWRRRERVYHIYSVLLFILQTQWTVTMLLQRCYNNLCHMGPVRSNSAEGDRVKLSHYIV